MPVVAPSSTQSGGFGLKHREVALIPQERNAPRTFVSVEQLEATRVERVAIPASKHGLEAICGASCDTGAQ
jgi:membrane glycosyltransferase